VFLLGTFTAAGRHAAFAGILGGSSLMLAVKLGTSVTWQWYVLIGSLATLAIGWAVSRAWPERHTATSLRP
jgi:hypothetical protein